MSNLFKKITSATMALLIVLSIVSPVSGVMAAYSTLEAANKLAALGVIVDNSANPANYRLGDSITRGEMAKVTMKLTETEVSDVCEGKFSDLTSADWACKYVEAGLANGIFAANATFRPMDVVTKIEALKMVMKARGIEKSSNADWMAAYVEAAVEAGVIESAFTDYNTVAVRGWIFQTAVNAVEGMANEGDDLLGDLLGDLGDETTGTDETTGSGETTESGVVVTGGVLSVSLSPETPAGATVPQNISGLAVAKFDLTAGDEDVTVTSMTLVRRGLSDESTLTGLAAFTSEGRASKSKDDSQNNNTEATLTLTNGLVVKAGETKTVTIVVDVANGTTSDEFALELKEVTASASVETEGSLLSNTMRVGGVEAETINVKTDGTFSNPKIGEVSADIFKFKVEGSNDRDVILKSITFKGEGSIDEEDEMGNYKLLHNGTEVASVASAAGKYITFNLGDGITIPEDNTEKFSVQADILAGADKTIAFKIDKTLDVTAIDTLYGYNTNVSITDVDAADGSVSGTNELGIQTVQAGEITLVDVDASNDKIRSNKTNVELGSINVTNISGNNLELQKFGVNVSLTDSGGLTLSGTFENFEVVVNGVSYELAEVSGGYADSDLSINLPQGTTNMLLRADTKENLTAGMKVDITLTTVNTQFYVVELGDDKQVTDLTPSSLSFKQLEVLASAATAAVTPTADLKVVRGAKDVVSSVFTVKASEASSLTMDEVKALVSMSGGNATSSQIAKVALYKDSVSDANKLDEVSGSQLASGTATFNGFTVDVAANVTRSFVVTVDFVDSDTVDDYSSYSVDIISLGLSDDESDDVFANGGTGSALPAALSSATDVTVTGAGELTVAYDSNNTDNTDEKTILAGESKIVYSADVQATNESVDVEKVVFTLSATGADLKAAISTATLMLDGEEITTNTNADIDAASGTITFDNLTNLIIPEKNVELALKLNTSTIGYQKVGETITGLQVSNVLLTTATGESSGKPVVEQGDSDNGVVFAIVPSVVTPSLVASFGADAQVKLTVNSGDNTQTGSNTTPVVTVGKLVFSNQGNATASGYTLYKEGNSATSVTGALFGTNIEFDLSSLGNDAIITDNKTYVIHTAGNDATTYGLKLIKQGVEYTTNSDEPTAALTTNMTSELDLGSKTY